jgi:hypothetical protein
MWQKALPTILLAILVCPSNAQTRVEPFQQVVQPYVDARMFMGSVLVAKKERLFSSRAMAWRIWNGMFPISDNPIQHRVDDETVHGSGDLIARGSRKVEDDDLVKKYLPAAPASWER